MTKPLILNEPASFQTEEMIEKLLELEDASGFSKQKKLSSINKCSIN